MNANQASQVPPSLRKRFEPVGGVSIPVQDGTWIAIFEDAESAPVVAFDHAGNALIVNEVWGALVRANAHRDFVRVDHVRSPNSSAATGKRTRLNGVAA